MYNASILCSVQVNFAKFTWNLAYYELLVLTEPVNMCHPSILLVPFSVSSSSLI